MNSTRYGGIWNITHDSFCLSVSFESSATEIILLALSIWLQFGVRQRNDVALSLPCQFESDTKRICCLLKVAKTRIILPFCDQRIESTFINIFFEKHGSYKLPSLAFSLSFWIFPQMWVHLLRVSLWAFLFGAWRGGLGWGCFFSSL